jgi:hypothetical protein
VELVQALRTHDELGALKILFLVEYRSGLRRAALAGLERGRGDLEAVRSRRRRAAVAAIRLAG